MRVAQVATIDAQGRREVPTVDIQKTCQAAAGVMVSLLGGSTTDQDVKGCLDSEQKAREQIIKDRATYSAVDKSRCMRTDVYLPSYVEWLTCLEMERDVRKMQVGNPARRRPRRCRRCARPQLVSRVAGPRLARRFSCRSVR